jgi:hypothetical protein
MFEIPTEIQWVFFCDRIRSLAQMRFCLYNLYMDGGLLFIEIKSCDDELAKHLYIINAEGEFV